MIMVKVDIKHQESFSRGQLLLRTLFGWLYIHLPHLFPLSLVGIWSQILSFISFWIILFTGSFPQSFFEFQVKYYKWYLRYTASVSNLTDEYPAFGVNGTSDAVDFDVSYQDSYSRGLVLLRFLSIFYVILPHGFVLFFRMIWMLILNAIAWWVVLFTGNYPQSFHEFSVDTIRWQYRVAAYLLNLTDDYPPFSGKA